MTGSQDHLEILAQLCHERGVNPSKGNYAGFVRSIVCGKMHLNNSTARQLTKTLTTAYYCDRWQSLLKELNCDADPDAEGSATRPQTWNPQQPQTPNKDTREFQAQALTSKQLGQILYRIARRDTCNNVGRITQADADEFGLTLEKAQETWAKLYPRFEAETRSNCLLIYWGGKAEVRSQRDSLRTIQPAQSLCSNPEGDVEDDTYDEHAPRAKQSEVKIQK